MAMLKNIKGKEGGGYERIFGNKELGLLLSKTQGAIISAGTELEKMITSAAVVIADFDSFIDNLDEVQIGVYLIPKKTIKKSNLKNNQEPDMLIFEIDEHKRTCYIIELKDGCDFDTKKSLAEKEALVKFQNHISRLIPSLTKIYVCCFNAENKDVIIKGFKKNITEDEAMTGQELCDLLNISYKKIVDARKKDQKANVDYFIDELLLIDEIKNKIKDKLSENKNK